LLENILAFKERRIRTTYSPKPFSKKNMADDFALALSNDLKACGLEIHHESERKIRLGLMTKAGYEFTIWPDAVILRKGEPKIYVEIKYMEKGIFNEPDTRKIAYDFMHFRKRYRDEFYVVVSGAELSAYRDVEPMLRAYTDRTFDININRGGWESRLQDMIEELRNMLDMKPSKDPILPSYQVKDRELCGASTLVPDESSLKLTISEVTSKGFEFEKRLKKMLVEQNIDFEPRTVGIGKEVKLYNGHRISLFPDICIPNLGDPRVILECKNMEYIDPAYAKTIATNSILLKGNSREAQFIVVCGERTRKISVGYMRGYVDDLVTNNAIPDFLIQLSRLQDL
jgi:hypothetical protein